MKQQLSRILNSDIATYKVAVTERIQNIQQIDECLTERSSFLQSFQEMLKKEMEKANLDLPSELSRNSFEYSAMQQRSPLKSLGQNCLEEKENYHDSDKDRQYRQSIKHLQLKKKLKKLSKMHQSYFVEVRKYLIGIKEQILLEANLTKDSLINQFQICVKNIVKKMTDLYEKKIEKLKQELKSTRKDDIKMQQKAENFVNCQKQPQIGSNTRQILQDTNRQEQKKKKKKLYIKMDGCFMQEPKQSSFIEEIKEQTDPEQRKNYHELQIPSTAKQYCNSLEIHDIRNSNIDNRCEFSFLSSSTIPIQNSLQQRTQRQEEYHYENNNTDQKYLEKMTLKNDKETVWKHYICDFSGSFSEQVSSQPKKMTKRAKMQNNFTDVKKLSFDLTSGEKQNGFRSFGSTISTLNSCKNSGQNRNNQPNFPSLLRKNFNQRSYDIPAVRPLAVSYPPIENGFSTLKFGKQIVYKGMWKYRKFHGKGKLMLPDYTYEGQFKSGLFDGRGTLKIGNIEFIGQFKDNKAHGEGTLKTTGKNISGKWKDNSLLEVY